MTSTAYKHYGKDVSSKNCLIWLKNKKVMVKICAVGNGTAPRHRKINPIFKLLDHAQS